MQFIFGIGSLIIMIAISLFAGVIVGVGMMALCSAARTTDDPLDETPFNEESDLGKQYDKVEEDM